MERTLIDNRYELGEPLGGGGMARVYLAHDRRLERDVAVKILRAQYAENREFVERFRREAQYAAGLSHPNVVQTYDWGETDDGGYYIAMEHVPNGSLSERIERDGALAVRTAAEVASQVADALGAAHEAGLIHRDVKPHNVLITDSGDVKVADFGIARAAEETSLSRTSAVLGTAAYMSPEQAFGRDLGPRSDLYSLGVVLYEMLTGEVPFTGASPIAVSLMHVNEAPRPPAEVTGEVSERMNALVMKLLSKDPAHRYGSASELIEELHRVSEGRAPLNAGVAGVANGGANGVAEMADAAGADTGGSTGGSESTTELVPPRRFNALRKSPRKRPLKRLLAMAVFFVAALIGAVGFVVWAGPEDPVIAGVLEGVPGEIRDLLAGGTGPDANSGEKGDETAEKNTFTHTATEENSRGDYTYLDRPRLDGDPNAVALAAVSQDGESTTGEAYEHNVGVWYDSDDRNKWAIFNQDLAPVPAGTTFEVVIPPPSESFVHRAEPANTVGNATYLDDPLTNGEPDAALSVTQNWNPGGGEGVYNDHPVDVFYDEDVQQWAIYNSDEAPMPDRATFNVAVSGSTKGAR